MIGWGSFWCLAFAASFVGSICAAETKTNSLVRDLGGGQLQIGLVTIDPKQKTVSFPASINMTSGVVEYLVVTSEGKVHESLLATKAEPTHIHTAVLLLGMTNATNSEAAAFFDSARELPGPRINVDISSAGSPDKEVPIQTLLMFAQSKKPVAASDVPYWVYNGSRFSDRPELEPVAAGSPPRGPEASKDKKQVFMAQREGSIVSLIADPSALVNNPRKDRENDELWILNTDAIPPHGAPVKVTFRLHKP